MFTLIPFEGSVYLAKATESMPLSPEQLALVDKAMSEGKSIEEMQEVLSNVWHQ